MTTWRSGANGTSGAGPAALACAAGGGPFISASDRAQPVITAAAEITALRTTNSRGSSPAGTSGAWGDGSSALRKSSVTSSLLDIVLLQLFVLEIFPR